MAEVGKGGLAQSMAAAPRAERKENPLHRLFRLVGFKLPNKSEAFKNDDGSTTRRLAYAIIRLADSQVHFNASIYEQTLKSGEIEVYCAMPSSGKGFPRPVFVTDDRNTQLHYDAWRVDIANKYLGWETDNTTAETPLQQSAIRVQRPRLVKPAEAVGQ